MKRRLSYVSNSSSTSFIVGRDLTPDGVCCAKLTRRQAAHIISRSVKYEIMENDRMHGTDAYMRDTVWMLKHFDSLYLTEMIRDEDGLGYRGRHVSYMYGQPSGAPYHANPPDGAVKILDNGVHSVWISRHDDPPVEREVPVVEVIERINGLFGDRMDMVIERSDVVRLMTPGYESSVDPEEE